MPEKSGVREFDQLPSGVIVLKVYRNGDCLLECSHDPGYRRDHDGNESDLCRVCKGTADATGDFRRFVKMLGRVPEEVRAAQSVLF